MVANRGEIALRVMRSAREMGIATVAVYSEADRKMPFVQFADEAVCIGPAASADSYLRGDRIIDTALRLHADAIHPGYGFLSEQASFARKTEEAGLIFIGPSAKSIEMMGSKLAAKQAARTFGVPLVPGTETPLRDEKEALAAAREIGFPILIKASGGGGGKGMRVVHDAGALEEQIRLAKSEAKNAFGDDAVFIEKYVASPRHVEIQILGDQWGNYVYLFERECSIQRRHQKLIEEAPSTCLDEALRRQMGECALQVARACAYHGAGTVEFLVDDSDPSAGLRFFFLEMNTRLQVEHPVTELITGIDLVKAQIDIADGQKLPYSQEELRISGHAVELRVCAEDPRSNFLPDTGELTIYERPSGPGIRVDDGYAQGLSVPVYYDSLLSKLVAWGKDRKEALDRLVRAIDEYHINGVATTLDFGRWAVEQPDFRAGTFDTHFIDTHFNAALLDDASTEADEVAALLGNMLWQEALSSGPPPGNGQPPPSAWRQRRNRV